MSGEDEQERLRKAWDDAIARDRPGDAASALFELERSDPEEPRWPHRLGEALRRLNRPREAEEAFVRATEKYVKQGFMPRAIAMAKLVAAHNPARKDLLARLQPAPAPPSPRFDDEPPPSVARPTVLRRADDAKYDEVRFDDADPDNSLGLDLTMEEFARSGLGAVPDPVTPAAPAVAPSVMPGALDSSPPPAAPPNRAASVMSAFRLFAGLPRDAMLALADAADLVELPAGTMLMRRRDPADSLLAIIEGTISIATPGLPPVYLGEGHVVGEGCLLDEAERQADVRAESPVMVLRIKKPRLDDVIRRHTVVEDALFALLARRLLTNLLQSSPLFTAFDPQARLELAQHFEIRRAEAGTIISARGMRSDGLYVLLAGVVTATSDRGAMRIALGDAFGFKSLLGADPAPQDVESVTESILLRLPASKFVALTVAYPLALGVLSRMEDDAIKPPETRRG